MSCAEASSNENLHCVSYNQNLKPEWKTGLVTPELSPNCFLLSLSCPGATYFVMDKKCQYYTIFHMQVIKEHKTKVTVT